MKKKEFLDKLEEILNKRNYKDKEEIINDFEEHFRIGEQEGKSEEEISKLLGDPKDIADQFKEENEDLGTQNETNISNEYKEPVKNENSSVTKLILALVLIFVNIVFVLGIVIRNFWGINGFYSSFCSNSN